MIGQAIADGLLSGAIIGLGAIGVSLGMQILRFANFSHSELLTWGAYIALTFTTFATTGASIGPFSFGWQLLLAIVVAGVGAAAIALIVDALVFRRLRDRGVQSVTMVFAAFGTGLILRNLVTLIWGTEAHYYTRKLQMAVEVLPGVRMLPDQMFVLGLAVVIVTGLHFFLKYTRFGVAMRGVAENPPLAQVCGVRVESVVWWTWIIGSAIAAAAGVFLGLTVQIRVEMGFNLLLALFTAAILGGSASLVGAFVGGLLVGLIENVSVLVISPGYKQAMPFIVMLVVFYFRPQGLFAGSGRRTS
jgi:branched-chain amino acid transport system permease protein